jgi:hypothetical protein
MFTHALVVAGIVLVASGLLIARLLRRSQSAAPITRGSGPSDRSRTLFDKFRALSGIASKNVHQRLRRFFGTFTKTALNIMHRRTSDAEILLALHDAWAAVRPDDDVKHASRRAKHRVDEISRMLDGKVRAAARLPSFTYLDIGAADGSITAMVAASLNLTPPQTIALDVVAPATTGAYTFQRTDGRSIDRPDGSINLITMFMSAHHFDNVNEMFAETGRVAADGATLIMREHGRTDRATVLFYDIAHAIYETVFSHETTPDEFAERYARGSYATYRTAAQWRVLANAAGFDYVSAQEPGADKFDTILAVFTRRGRA